LTVEKSKVGGHTNFYHSWIGIVNVQGNDSDILFFRHFGGDAAVREGGRPPEQPGDARDGASTREVPVAKVDALRWRGRFHPAYGSGVLRSLRRSFGIAKSKMHHDDAKRQEFADCRPGLPTRGWGMAGMAIGGQVRTPGLQSACAVPSESRGRKFRPYRHIHGGSCAKAVATRAQRGCRPIYTVSHRIVCGYFLMKDSTLEWYLYGKAQVRHLRR